MRSAVLAAAGHASAAGAQTIDDGLMMPRGQLCTGFVYAHDAWDRYWEGTLERDNGNVGTLTHAERRLDGHVRDHRPAERDRDAALGEDRRPAPAS